jgi:hypothetical protein
MKPEKLGALVEAVERWHRAIKQHGHCECGASLTRRVVD